MQKELKRNSIIIVLAFLITAFLTFYLIHRSSVSDVRKDATLHSLEPDSSCSPNPIEIELSEQLSDTTVAIQISKSSPQYSVHIHSVIKSDSINEDSFDHIIYQLDIAQNNQSSLMQSIKDTCDVSIGMHTITFKDVNFDGFLDIEFLEGIAPSGNESFHFWTFDTNAQRYSYNSEFSETIGGMDISLSPDKKQISTGYRNGRGGGSCTYQVTNGHLILMEETSDEEIIVNDSTKTKTTIKKLINGEMKVVEETIDE